MHRCNKYKLSKQIPHVPLSLEVRTHQAEGDEFQGVEGEVSAEVGRIEGGDGGLVGRPHVHHSEDETPAHRREEASPVVPHCEVRRCDLGKGMLAVTWEKEC